MKLLRLLNLALQFSTRIPGFTIKYNEKELGASGVFFPFIGLLLGTILYFEARFFAGTNLIVSALLIIVTGILLSGGLHLDGFMDTMDGLMSGTKDEKMLTIMSDSHVGAHSVTMLFVLLMSKLAFLIAILQFQPLLILILPMIGRIMMLLCIVYFPYAKKKGIGLIYKDNLSPNNVYILALAIILVLIILMPIIAVALFATLSSIIIFSKNIFKKIGGLTGDVYGAIAEISEVLFMFFIFITYTIIGG